MASRGLEGSHPMKLRLTGLAAVGLLSIFPAVAESREYQQGTLNVKCSCKKLNVERMSWHHIVNVPSRGLNIDLSDVCKVARNNYNDVDAICLDDDDYVGEEYSFDPKN